jgi:hypothetical protein
MIHSGSADPFDVDVSDPIWRVSAIGGVGGAAKCEDATPALEGTGASAATGFIHFGAQISPGGLPCTIASIDVQLMFPPTDPDLDESDAMLAHVIPIEGTCR